MTSGTLSIAFVLATFVLAFEFYRRVKRKPFNLLSVTNGLFVLIYCIPPFFIEFVPGTSWEVSPGEDRGYGVRFFVFTLVERISLGEKAYLTAVVLSVVTYVAILAGYFLAIRWITIPPLNPRNVSKRLLLWSGILLGLISASAFIVYSAQFTELLRPGSQYDLEFLPNDPLGIFAMLKLGGLVRGGKLQPALGFLQIIILLGIPAMIFLAAARSQIPSVINIILLGGAVLIWFVVFSRGYHVAGRMELMTVCALVPLALLLGAKPSLRSTMGAACLVGFGIVMAQAPWAFFVDPAASIGGMLETVGTSFGGAILYIVNEFAFPHAIAANTSTIVPTPQPYRYFIDFPLATLYMLPSIGGPDSWPKMISHLHGDYVPMLMPYDLISLGFYSLGWTGVVVISVLFGLGLGMLDRWLKPGGGWLVNAFRAAWMMYLPFRMMYADPYTSMKTGFGLIVGTVVLIALIGLSRRTLRLENERHDVPRTD